MLIRCSGTPTQGKDLEPQQGCAGEFVSVTTNLFGLFFAIVAVFFEQVYPQENIHAEIDGQANLEDCLSTTRASDQQFSAVP